MSLSVDFVLEFEASTQRIVFDKETKHRVALTSATSCHIQGRCTINGKCHNYSAHLYRKKTGEWVSKCALHNVSTPSERWHDVYLNLPDRGGEQGVSSSAKEKAWKYIPSMLSVALRAVKGLDNKRKQAQKIYDKQKIEVARRELNKASEVFSAAQTEYDMWEAVAAENQRETPEEHPQWEIAK